MASLQTGGGGQLQGGAGPVAAVGQTTFRVPSSIAASTLVDATADLNSWLATVPNGTAQFPVTIVFPSGSGYRIDGTLGSALLAPNPAGLNRRYLRIVGEGVTLDWSLRTPTVGENRAGLGLVAATGCDLSGFTVVGPFDGAWQTDYDPDYEHQHGIAVFESTGCLVHDMSIYNSPGDAVSLSGTDDTDVEDMYCEGAGRMGVALTANNGIGVRRSTFDRIGYHVLDLEPESESHPVENVAVEANTVRRHRFSFVAAESGVCSPRSGYSITDNIMENTGITSLPPIAVASTSYSTTLPDCTDCATSDMAVERNVLRSTTNNLHAMRFRGVTDVIVNDNLVYQSAPFSDRVIVMLEACAGDLQVKRNTCAGTPGAYAIDGVVHGPGVASCGNTTAAGSNIPAAC